MIIAWCRMRDAAMADAGAWLPGVIGAAALAASLCWFGFSAWFVCRLRPPRRAAQGRVTLLLCVTGRSAHLPALFAALARQSLRPRRLVVAVESVFDPACAQVMELAPGLPFPVETVIAGTASHRSQKATNLIAAARRVDAADEAVVLFDADIVPPPEWLSWLASPVLRGTWDVVSGYRWQIAGHGGLARQAVTWLDRAFALAARQLLWRQVWGGSVAFSAAAFARLDLPTTLERAFSTDAAISRRAKSLALRILARRAVLLPTPADGGEKGAIAFQRRQFQLYRLHAPGAFAGLGLILAAEAGALLLLPAALAGSDEATGWLAAMLAAGAARVGLHEWTTHRLGIAEPPVARLAQVGCGLFSALPALFGLLLVASAARPRRIRWRHVEYELRGPEEVRVIARHAPAGG